MKILLTSTSFLDTPGKHHDALKDTGFDVENIRGPVKEDVLLPVIAKYDGVICGDDEITSRVIEIGSKGNLKVISKYGIGLDKVDLKAAKKYDIHVTNCPGVNHITVAEHFFALLLSFYKNIPDEISYTRSNLWKRLIGHELQGKKIGIAGLGRIGKEIILRAEAFNLKLYAYDQYIDTGFVKLHSIQVCKSLEELFNEVDIVSLNMSINTDNYHCINRNLIEHHTKKRMLIINTARGALIDEDAILFGLENRILSGYLADVLEEEPIIVDHPLLHHDNVFITPHIGSRTYESVQRQGVLAVNNLIEKLALVQ